MCLVYPAHENADYNIGFKPESKGEKKRAAGAKTPRPGVARGYSKGIFSKVSVCVRPVKAYKNVITWAG